MDTVFYGSTSCTHPKCQNKAYWLCDDQLLCGVHSRKRTREPLPKDPQAKQKRQKLNADRYAMAQQLAEENKEMGSVIVTKLKMRQLPEHVDGYLKVFPNARHANRQDGIGCATLSPMHIGPIEHHEFGLPPATNLENWFQFAKCYSHEVDPNTGDPLPEFWETLRNGYLDPTPHRHKFSKSELAKRGAELVPLFAVRRNREGKIFKFGYVESRFFYCSMYERHVQELDEFKKLQQLLHDGWNLQIVGYDGHPVDRPIQEIYEDPSLPFGHEMVLYTMLTELNRNKYPWNVYLEAHQHDVYQYT